MGMLLAIVVATTASAGHVRTYILNGYSLSSLKGVLDTAALEAKLGRKEGARITDADIAADTAIVAAELKAHHAQGRLTTGTAEKHGRIWIIFDLLDPEGPMRRFWAVSRHLTAQAFEGAAGVPVSDLTAATGLKPGDPLSRQKIDAGREAIIKLYAKQRSGKVVSVRARMQSKPTGDSTLTWIITRK